MKEDGTPVDTYLKNPYNDIEQTEVKDRSGFSQSLVRGIGEIPGSISLPGREVTA